MLDGELLDEWMGRYPELPTHDPQRILIVMAGNIPLVGMFDLVCVLMAGHHAVVKPSHKDRVLMEWIIETLLDIDPSTPINIYSGSEEIDRVIATGGDAALAHFQNSYADKPTLLRGARYSAALITHRTSQSEMGLLAEDIYSYSGLGCRNVSLLFVPRDMTLPEIPHDAISPHPKYMNNYRQCRAIYTLSAVEFHDTGISCLVEGDHFPTSPSTITIVRYTTIEDVEQWLLAHDKEVQCVVTDTQKTDHPRCVAFGHSQSPTLTDYADGVDTMEFLS
ncbi:MAG: acyl-CoA reductase [Rikenellaceae bacterium]